MDDVPTDAGTSLRNLVLRRVRADIVSGHSGPGTMFSVPSLAEEMGISTTPGREALLELSHGGLIGPVKNRGFRVEETKVEQMRDLFDLRVLLERHAMVTLARHRLSDASDLRSLAEAVAEAVARADSPAYVEADRAFHQALIVRAGNPMLTKLAMDLRDGMRLHGIDSPAGRERQRASIEEHERLLTMAEIGDAEGIGL